MGFQIEDGSGFRYAAKVDNENRLFVRSFTQADSVHANSEGDAYNLNTGFITLSDAVDTPVLYLKNNEEKSIIVEAIAVGIFASTGGTGDNPHMTIIRNPTVGTIITSTPTNIPINSNRNYGSNKSLTADAFKGATGDTMTDGDDHILVHLSTNGRGFIGINEVIPKGSSMGIKIKPQTDNSSMKCYVAVIMYLAEEL